MLCDNLQGWNVVGGGREVQEGGDICVPMGELKWTGMGEFNSDDHFIYYCGQESLRRNGVAIMVNKSPKCSIWMQSQKRQNETVGWHHRFNGHEFEQTLGYSGGQGSLVCCSPQGRRESDMI